MLAYILGRVDPPSVLEGLANLSCWVSWIRFSIGMKGTFEPACCGELVSVPYFVLQMMQFRMHGTQCTYHY
jgi:hypothetical protein